LKVHAAVDTLGHLFALHATPASGQDRAQVEELAEAVQEATGESVELAYVEQGYTGEEPAEAAEERHSAGGGQAAGDQAGLRAFAEAVVERDFAWASRFRRLVKDYERLPATVAGLHFIALAGLLLHRAIPILGSSV
jgi:hypothetical protein